jgi:transposase
MQKAKDIGRLVQELGVSRQTLYRWKDSQLRRAKSAREPEPRKKKLEEEIQRLKESLANRTVEVDFFMGALQRVKARRQGNTATGGEASTTKFEAGMQLQGKLTIERMCQLAGMPRWRSPAVMRRYP